MSRGIEETKTEIFNNGPVLGLVPVSREFLNYKSGVYSLEPEAKLLGNQAVKIIGWNQENGNNYWVIENSWGEGWGLNGLAFIDMGDEHI